jgi:hypothetical protein
MHMGADRRWIGRTMTICDSPGVRQEGINSGSKDLGRPTPAPAAPGSPRFTSTDRGPAVCTLVPRVIPRAAECAVRVPTLARALDYLCKGLCAIGPLRCTGGDRSTMAVRVGVTVDTLGRESRLSRATSK